MEFFVNYAWLIAGLPLAAALLIALTGKWIKPLAHIPAILAMVAAAVIAVGLVVGFSNGQIDPAKYPKAGSTMAAGKVYQASTVGQTEAPPSHEPELRNLQRRVGQPPEMTDNANTLLVPLFHWFSAGALSVSATLHLDYLTAIYMLFVTLVGLLIFIYAAGYMKGDYGYWRFFSFFSLFVFFMAALVMGGNFVLLYLGWEGVGLASYLLIGYYYPRPSAVAAAKKAFITNRIGDFGFAIGIFLIYKTFGTFTYVDIFAMLRDPHFLEVHHEALTWIPVCLMVGAFGKSAQFPLHVWLPDAMEGPTPVSALIHAATMVTAGIYMIARCMPLFLQSPYALDAVAIIGCFTAFMAATMAMCQYDLKRIWAYSTLSQLGYMFLGLGVMKADSAVFHVFTHAWFKALLFLSAGSVMHAMGGELDLRKMSGLRKVMPITAFTMLVGCMALAGVPGLSGFFSKDEIIHATFERGGALGIILGLVALLVALITAYYTFRLFFRVFGGPLALPATAGHHEPSPFAIADEHAPAHGVDTVHAEQGHEEASHGEDARGISHAGHGHETHAPSDGSPLLWLPLLALSIGAIGAGYLGVVGGTHGAEGEAHGGWFHWFLGHSTSADAFAPYIHHPHVHAAVPSAATFMAISGILAIAGIAIAWYFHLQNRHAATIVAANLRPVVKFLENRWYIDDLYNAVIIRTLWIFSHILSIFDRFIVDGAVFFVGFVPQLAGYSLKPTQRGLLQRYAVGMLAGIAAIVAGVLYVMR